MEEKQASKPIANATLNEALFHYKAHVWQVTDGDTIKVHWDLGRRTFADEVIRFSRINAYEMKTDKGKEAKQFVLDRIMDKDVILKTELDSRGMTKYGGFDRFLAEVFYETDEGWINLNDELLENELAVIYKK